MHLTFASIGQLINTVLKSSFGALPTGRSSISVHTQVPKLPTNSWTKAYSNWAPTAGLFLRRFFVPFDFDLHSWSNGFHVSRPVPFQARSLLVPVHDALTGHLGLKKSVPPDTNTASPFALFWREELALVCSAACGESTARLAAVKKLAVTVYLGILACFLLISALHSPMKVESLVYFQHLAVYRPRILLILE